MQNNLDFNGLFTTEMCVIFTCWLIYAIGTNTKVLNNKFTKFISDISMEIYLCHMVIFRLIEKIHLTVIFENNVVSYIFVSILTFGGSILFALIINKIIKKLYNCFDDVKRSRLKKVQI